MATYVKPADVISRCEELRKLWLNRNKNIATWYGILHLTDELKQKNMESVVANDPRTFYNTALYLLTPDIPHRVPVQGLDPEAIAWTSSMESVVRSTWSDLERQYRRRGRKSWLEYMVGLLLATGWYSVLCMAASDKLVAEVWNPIEVFPDWDSQGLYATAHIFTQGSGQAARLFQQRGWHMPPALVHRDVTIYDLWEVTGDGVINATVAGSAFVKDETVEAFEEIPILVGPVGGLPDDGPISTQRRTPPNQEWRANVGQSILAPNSAIYHNYNRMASFMQQILRDTAQPKYWEKSRGTTILTPENLEKRGAIFRLGEGDDVGTIQMPGIPVELTALINSYEQQLQRGALPHALSGQVQNIPLGLMSQVAAAAVQVLSLYHRAITGLLSDIDNIWVSGILNGTFEAQVLTIPDNVTPDMLKFDVQYPIHIPGDLVQRATITRMIAPSARMSASTGLDLFFPEIEDPDRELAQARADDAQASPVFVLLNLISALREEAKALRLTGHNEDADLLDRAQEAVEANLSQPEQSSNSRRPGGVPPRGLAPNTQALLRELGAQVEGES